MFLRKPTNSNNSASPSVTALLVMLGFRLALANTYNYLMISEELSVVNHLINTALAKNPKYAAWKSFINLPIQEQQTFLYNNITPGFDAHKLARKLMIKNKIENEIDNKKIEQVVFLSGGYDHRSFMLSKKYPHIQIFELDRGETRKIKIDGLKTLPNEILHIQDKQDHMCINHNLHLIECDFLKDDLHAALKAHGYDPQKSTFILGEGLTMYLSQSDNQNLLNKLFDLLSNGEEVLLSFRRTKANPTAFTDKMHASANETFQFSIASSDIPAFINAIGFELTGKMLCSELLDWIHCHQEESRGDDYYLLKRNSLLLEQKKQAVTDINSIPLIVDREIPKANYRPSIISRY
jgi:methyltransferase (TIGR00027 family)